jgi:hypothetical protein
MFENPNLLDVLNVLFAVNLLLNNFVPFNHYVRHLASYLYEIETQYAYLLKCLSHRKPCKIPKNVTKLISVRKKSYTFSKYLMPSIL